MTMAKEQSDLILMHIEQLREDFAEERRMAHESRAVVHRRLDEQAKEIAELNTKVTVAGHVIEQAKADIKTVGDRVTKNYDEVSPTVAEWKRIKVIGIGIGGMLAIGGLSIASAIAWFGELFWNWLRHLLKIN